MLGAWSDSARQGRATLRPAAWHRVQFTLFRGTEDELNWDGILDALCVRSPDSCAIAARAAAEELTLAQLEWRVLEQMLRPARLRTVAELKSLELRWAAYLAHGPAVYPWELWLVGRRVHPTRELPTFPSPPNGQWVLLHPGTGYQHVRVGSAKLDEALALEALGYRGWSWRNDNLHPRFGASALLAWDGDTKGHVATGLLVHLLPPVSFGAAYRATTDKRSRWPIYVSTDLGKLITSRDELRKTLESHSSGGPAKGR
jgi:hypothetical protein